jgi:A/G-specific adenine glycosylase
LASQQVRWVEPERLAEFPFPAANARIIAALRAWLGGLDNPGHGGRELPWA